jgi:hypothetical protein
VIPRRIRGDDVATEDNPGVASISWRTIAFGAGIVAVASLIALSVISTQKNVEALTAVALALAILSFLMQIVFYIVQTQNAASQLRASEQTNIRTQGVLTEIGQRTESVETALGGQMEKMLDWFLSRVPDAAREAGAKSGGDPETLERLFDSRVRALREEWGRSQAQDAADATESTPRRRFRSAERTAEQMSTALRELGAPVSKKDQDKAEATVNQLTEKSREGLVRLLADEASSLQSNQFLGLPEGVVEDATTLARLGLIDAISDPMDPPDPTLRWVGLTPQGRLAARLLRDRGAVVNDE